MKIKSYIIGIEDSYRGALLEKQLTNAAVTFERVNGVVGIHEGKDVRVFADQIGAERVIGRQLSVGEIGCALAHRSVYQRIVDDTGSVWALVLEDDALLCRPSGLVELFRLLENFDAKTPTVLSLYALSILIDKPVLQLRDNIEVSEVLQTPTSTVAYFVNRAAAEIFLAESLPLVSPADWPQRAEGKIRHLVAFPFPFEPDFASWESTINQRDAPNQEFKLSVRMLRLGAKLLCVDWVINRRSWGSFRSYWRTNIVGFVTSRVMGERVKVVLSGSERPARAPRSLRYFVRLIGGGSIR